MYQYNVETDISDLLLFHKSGKISSMLRVKLIEILHMDLSEYGVIGIP